MTRTDFEKVETVQIICKYVLDNIVKSRKFSKEDTFECFVETKKVFDIVNRN